MTFGWGTPILTVTKKLKISPRTSGRLMLERSLRAKRMWGQTDYIFWAIVQFLEGMLWVAFVVLWFCIIFNAAAAFLHH
jgi:hypothetical protein